MFNLLIESDKKRLYREYIFRLVIIVCAALSVTLCIGTLLLLPPYVLSRTREEMFTEKLELIKTHITEQDAGRSIETLKKTKGSLDILKPAGKDRSPHSTLSMIIGNRLNTIKLTSLAYTWREDGVEIVINGVSSDRESLLEFSKKLEKEPLVARVDLPVSNFAKNKDIDFVMRIYGK